MKALIWAIKSFRLLNEAPARAFAARIENQIDLIEPGGLCRGQVEMNVCVTLQPAIVLGLVGVEIVENNMEFAAGVLGDDAVHEIEEFDAAPTLVLAPGHLAGCNVQSREQSRRAMTLAIMRLPGQRPAVSDNPACAPAPGSTAFRRR